MAALERIWDCKIGGKAEFLPQGCDLPMRRAVEQAYKAITGRDSEFLFSGWGAKLTEPERACIERRQPSPDYHAQWLLEQSAQELLEALRGVVAVADRDTDEFIRARAAIARATGATP